MLCTQWPSEWAVPLTGSPKQKKVASTRSLGIAFSWWRVKAQEKMWTLPLTAETEVAYSVWKATHGMGPCVSAANRCPDTHTHTRILISAHVTGVFANRRAPCRVFQLTEADTRFGELGLGSSLMWTGCWPAYFFDFFCLYPGCSSALLRLLIVSYFPWILSQNKQDFIEC